MIASFDDTSLCAICPLTKKPAIGKSEANCDAALVSNGNLLAITTLDVRNLLIKEDRVKKNL